ncbi:MAG: hypothetical protein ACQEP7_00975 [bacterium]
MVTPMELQVLFMQESRAASETDKHKRFPAQRRAQIARRRIAETKRESVDEVDTAETKTVDEEGGQGSAGYFAQRQQQAPELAEEEKNKPPPSEEEGKGNVMDLTI